MSVFIKNNEGLTPRGLAEKISKSKYHRVIKNLKKYESIEESKKVKIRERKVKKVIKY